jgi:hypothetical protein
MLFAPECAQRPLQAGEIVWGSEPLPVVDKYKYLGVMLASDWTWQAHVEHVVAKATTASYALGSVLHILHNRRLDTEIRRQGGTISQGAASTGVLFHGLACGH